MADQALPPPPPPPPPIPPPLPPMDPGGYQYPPIGGAYAPYGAYPPPPPGAGGYGQPAPPGPGGYGPPLPPPYGGEQGGMPPPPPPPPRPPSPPANFQLGALLPQALKVQAPAHSLQFDEPYFLRLLAGSISLTKDEKIRIIDSIPKLKQSQIDELIRIFDEEKRKFAELGAEHIPQLERLAKQHYEDWVDIEMHYAQQSKKVEEDQKAEELRKKLGLG